MVRRSTAAHEKLELAEAGRLLYDFFWGDFADWYIEVRRLLSLRKAAEEWMRCGGALVSKPHRQALLPHFFWGDFAD